MYFKKMWAILLICMPFFNVFHVKAANPERTCEKKAFMLNEDIGVLLVYNAIKNNNLTKLKDQCLAYDYDETSDKVFAFVDVRENNRYAICNGDPETSTHLFRFRIKKEDGALSTDANSVDGSFHQLKK